MKSRIMYIELKTHDGGHDDKGPARIGRVTFSKTGRTLYYQEKASNVCIRVVPIIMTSTPGMNRGILDNHQKST